MKFGKYILKQELVVILGLSLVACGFEDTLNTESADAAELRAVPFQSTEPEYSDPEVNFYEEKAINDEYIGHLYFESGLIDQKVVQTDDNEKYLDTDFEGNYFSSGSAFMDYRNTLMDENIIIYGHYVYADESKMFSPLHQLEDEANYEGNKYLYFALEDEVRKYEVADVYYYEMGSESLEYFHTEYSADELSNYLKHVHESEFYSTGTEISNLDHFLTLQTCVRGRDDLRLIVIAKQVD